MTKLEEFDLSKIEKLECTNNIALVSIRTFVESVVDSELRTYNKHYPVFDYENKCLKMNAPLVRLGTHCCTLVLPFKDIIDECGDDDCNPERVFFELGLFVMEEMKERLEIKFEKFIENIQKEFNGEFLDD